MPARPIWDYPMAAAQIAAREGIPAEGAYEVLASLGADISRADFLRLYGQAELAIDMLGATAQAPLGDLPDPSLIQHRSTVTSSGLLYQLSVTAIDRESDQQIEIPYSIRTDEPITPGEAIDAAVVSQTLRAPDYNLDVLSAHLTGIYELIPEIGT